MNYIVYMHLCPNGKRYIGITSNTIQKRWGNGCNYKRNKHFYNAIKKYGWNNIEHIILYENVSKEFACEKEIELISKYKSNDKRYGYNCSIGGEINKGYHIYFTKEHKQKISNSLIGKTLSEETKNKIRIARAKQIPPMKGKHWSKEMRKKLSLARKDKKAILQCDMNGIPIREWESLMSIEYELKPLININRANISECCKGKRKTHKGFIWKYKDIS